MAPEAVPGLGGCAGSRGFHPWAAKERVDFDPSSSLRRPLRLFVAIVPPPPLPARLHTLQERLRPCGADVKWVETQNLHVTLKFLGEVPEARVSTLRATLRSLAAPVSSFSLRLAGAGYFPPRGTPRVIWVGLDEGFGALRALHASVDEALARIGFAREERPFAAHVTLGRLRSPGHEDALKREIMRMQDEEVGRFTVDGFSLVQSQLTRQGPVYTHVEDYSLART